MKTYEVYYNTFRWETGSWSGQWSRIVEAEDADAAILQVSGELHEDCVNFSIVTALLVENAFDPYAGYADSCIDDIPDDIF